MVSRGGEQIPPKGLVRFVGVVLLLMSIVIMFVAVTNIAGLGWLWLVVFLGGLTSAGFAGVAIYTGNPEWILLDLMLPG